MSNSGLSNFLFQGAAPSTSAVTKSGSPQWLQQGLFSVANAAGNLAQQPYQPWQGPYVATPSAQTQQAWQLAGRNVGSYSPYLQQAGALTGQAATPLNASSIQQFVNPYQNYITGALNQNLQQNILPQLSSEFVSAGQSRSPQEAQAAGLAVGQTQNAIGQSLVNVYQNALNNALQQKQQTGALGAQYGQLGALTSQLGANDVAQLAAAGQGQDVLSQANIYAGINAFNQQQQWPYQQLGFLSNMLYGLPLQAVGTTTAQQGTYYPQTMAGFGSLLGGAQTATGYGYRRGGRVRQAPRRGGRVRQAPRRGALAHLAEAA